jgi:AsmA protein
MKRKLLIGLGTATALVAAVLAVPALIPVDAYKGRIVAAIEAATGREAKIAGHIHLSLLPNPEFVARKVSLANGPGQAQGDIVTIGKLSIRVGLMPLLHGNLVVHSLVLKEPVIALAVARNGRNNWDFGAGPGNAAGAASWLLSGLSLGRARLADGRLSYSDARTGAHFEAQAIDATVTLPSPTSPLRTEGALTWQGARLTFGLKLADPAGFMAGKPSAVEAKAEMPGALHLAFLGTLADDAKGLKAEGTVSFDAIDAKGTIVVANNRARPTLDAKLAIDKLDLNPYLAAAGHGRSPDLAPLRLADANLDLDLGSLTLDTIRIAKSHVTARLAGGKLDATIADMVLYSGGGRARIAMDATGPVPAFTIDSEFSGLQLAALMRDLAGGGRVSGSASLSFRGSARGASPPAIMGSLAGGGHFDVRNGAIGGSDLLAMIRNVQNAFDPASRSGQQTDFAEMSGNYAIRGNIVTNNDLDLRAPAFRVAGRGTIDLAHRTLNYRIEPKLVAPAFGAIGLTVPIIVTGSIDDPSYTPDLAGAVGSTLRGVGNLIPGASAIPTPPNPVDIVKGLFGH